MSIFPVRDVAKYGVITDQDPYDLPTEAWSLACNVRFQNRKVTRGPVWRAVKQPLSESNPRFVVGNTFNTGQDDLFVGYETGDVKQLLNGTETLSPIGRHRYFHKLYALDITLDLKGATKSQIERAMQGHILANAELIGTYQKGDR